MSVSWIYQLQKRGVLRDVLKGVCCEDTSCCPEDFSCLPPPGGCGLARQNNTDNEVTPSQFSITSQFWSATRFIGFIHQGLEWQPRIPLVKASLAPIVDDAGDCGTDFFLCTPQVSKLHRMLVQLFSSHLDWYQSRSGDIFSRDIMSYIYIYI